MLFHPPISVRQRSKQQGFTLIELLVVIAIVLVLAGITFGISRGVQNAQARARVKADLAVLAQALEQFKGEYGDYPWTAYKPGDGELEKNGALLLSALDGVRAWNYAANDDGDEVVVGLEYDSSKAQYKRSYLDTESLSLNDELVEARTHLNENYWALDPWGNPYVYVYSKGKGGWENFGYILYSMGPDGTHEPAADDGILTNTLRNHANNLDNIYGGE